MVRYLMPAGEHTADESFVMYSPALFVLPEVGIVVVGYAAPGGGAEASRLVGVVFRGIADNVEGALRPELLEGVQYHVGKRSPAEEIRRGGHIHRPVVKRHGANSSPGLDALYPPRVRDMVLLDRGYELFYYRLAFFPYSD